MLAEAGLVEGTDYETVLLDGFDPVAADRDRRRSSASPATRATSRARSSAPASPFDLFDPVDYDIPGSFGVIYTNRAVPRRTPDARSRTSCAPRCAASTDAIADPAAAAPIAVDRINANGNPNFLSPEGETFRWTTDAASPDDRDPGRHRHTASPIATLLQAELDAYAAVGLFGGYGAPTPPPYIDAAPDHRRLRRRRRRLAVLTAGDRQPTVVGAAPARPETTGSAWQTAGAPGIIVR